MPLFAYVCRDCGGTFEYLIRNGEEPQCTQCGSLALTRQVSAAAPLRGAAAAVPAGCGAAQCCMAQGGCCPN